MRSKKVNFQCSFDVIGRQSSHSWNCFFDITDEISTNLILHTNNQTINNPSNLDLIRYKIVPVSGILQNKNKSYIHTKVEFIKMNEINSSFGNVITDICYTDDGGRYKAYIPSGVYNIDIFINNQKITKYNIHISSKLKYEYYFTVNGMILDKYKDMVKFCGTDYKMIYGQLVDNKNTPIENAEIIILDNNGLCVYRKTDNDGKYSFAIKNGKYKVKIRAKDSPVKMNDIEIDDTHGFGEQLISNSNLFSKKQMIYL